MSTCLIYIGILFCGYFAEAKINTIKTIKDVKLNQQGITVNETCVASSECAGKLLCYSGVCDCALGHFWSGTDCLLKKGYQENCGSFDECQETFICDGTCQCSEIDYWDGHSCSTKKPANADCSTTIECRDTLYCSRHICQCFATDYWTGSSCSLRKSIDSPCTSTLECKDTLKCIDSNCTCRKSDFWNGRYCTDRKTVNMECSLPTECREELICLRNKCQCPVSDYWDGSKCDKQKTVDENCVKTSDCKDSLHCILGKCQCPETEYWSVTTCLPRKPVDSVCVSSKECKENLECTINYRCRCKNTHYWDGIRCSPNLPTECSDIAAERDGVYSIYPGRGVKMSVYCLMRGEKKWTVIQRRFDGSTDFRRSWREYKNGFGSAKGEYWLGNENIHLITQHGSHELSVYIQDLNHNFAFANYSTFGINNEGDNYLLSCGGYSGGSAGDSFCGHVSGNYFSTYDDDNQNNGCVKNSGGGAGWWYYSCGYYSALNGKYNGTSSKGFKWYHWNGSWHRPLKASLLMIRRK